MAQTTQLGYLVNPSGHRLVVQGGTHAFSAANTSVTLTVRFRRLYAALCSPEQITSGNKTTCVGAYIPYVTASMYTQAGVPGQRLIVKRQGGGIAGLKFSYAFIGC